MNNLDKSTKENSYQNLKKVAFAAVISYAVTFLIAVLVALIPVKPVLVEDSIENSDKTTETSNDSTTSDILLNPGTDQAIISSTVGDSTTSIDTNEIITEDKKLANAKEADGKTHVEDLISLVSEEFSWLVFWVLFVVIGLFAFWSKTFEDYFPVNHKIKESGIHAKLNYQTIADRMTRKLSILLSFLIIFSISFIFIIFKFSSELDLIIHQDDIGAYENWIESIEKQLGKDEDKTTLNNDEKYYDFVETNTELFWSVYFIRFIVVRLFAAFLVATIITFLIRIYLRTKNDRALIIQKEEALSAIHYLARGEWRYQYDVDGNLLFKGEGKRGEILTEKEFKEKDSIEKQGFKPLLLDSLQGSDKGAHISTKDLLNYIPIHELFRSTSYDKSKKSKEAGEVSDYSANLDTIKKQLSDISDELAEIVSIAAKAKKGSS